MMASNGEMEKEDKNSSSYPLSCQSGEYGELQIIPANGILDF